MQKVYFLCQVTRAEVKIANFMVEHNVPFAVADHLSPLLRDVFPDSQIAKRYSSARTKTTCVLNMAIAPHFQGNYKYKALNLLLELTTECFYTLKPSHFMGPLVYLIVHIAQSCNGKYFSFTAALVEEMKASPFSLLVDGSNDTGVEKLNPLTVKIFDITRREVVSHLLDMCTTSGRDCGTSMTIFSKIDSVLEKYSIPWGNCVGFGVDNTSVNIGLRHSIMTHVQQKNAECYFMGCPCHLVHNIAGHASEALHKVAGFDVEDLCVDVFYWFDKSTKRKGILREFCNFCDSDYREVVRYVNVRWLSLEKAVYRILQLYSSLQSYFKSEAESQARFKRLATAFEDPMTEVYLLFYQSVLPTFTRMNLLLQREDPNIHLVADSIRVFMRKLLSKFVTIQAIKAEDDVTLVDFQNSANQLDDSAITIGMVTKQRLRKLLNEGDISAYEQKKFYRAARAFYVDASSQALKKLPFDDCLLGNAKFTNFEKRAECTFESVEFFCVRYSHLLHLSPRQMDRLQEEFTDYQLLDKHEIPETVWNEALVFEEETEDTRKEHHRMDTIWAYLSGMKSLDSSLRFKLLSKLARLVLVIPHSNAGEERVFSLIKQNKSPGRSNLDAKGTLSSMIQIKLANRDSCTKWEPSKDVLKAAKRATKLYNDMHKK